jgi:hypothetical protein
MSKVSVWNEEKVLEMNNCEYSIVKDLLMLDCVHNKMVKIAYFISVLPQWKNTFKKTRFNN